MPEYLYFGLDKEIKWKDIDGGDSSDYTFGWNAEHPLLAVEGSTAAWEVNSVTVNGRGSATGSASDGAQIAAAGTRLWTIYDQELDEDAECAQRAQAELDQFEADATIATLVCRPCHGLELYDIVTVSSPPWGGGNIVGRVIRFREEWNHDGRWHQVIGLGAVPDKDPGNQPARRKRRKGRRTRRRKSSRRKSPISNLQYPPGEAPWNVPIGGIIMWSGAVAAIPTGWVLCDGTNGTPNLTDRFVIGAGSTYSPGNTGGAATINIRHTHGPGTLAADDDAHAHDVNQTQYANPGAGTTYFDTASQTESDTHNHTISGATASDAHSHDVDSGTTANALSTAQSILPPYYALAFIMRIS